MILIISGEGSGGFKNDANHCLVKFLVNDENKIDPKSIQGDFNMQLVKSDSGIYLFINFLSGSQKSFAFAFNIDQVRFVSCGYILLGNSKKCRNKEFKEYKDLSESEQKRYLRLSAGMENITHADALSSGDIQVSGKIKRFLENGFKKTLLIDYPVQFDCKTEVLNSCLESYKYNFLPYLNIPFSEDSKGNIPSLNCFLRKTKVTSFVVDNYNLNSLSNGVWLNDAIVNFYLFWLTKTNDKVFALDPIWNAKGMTTTKAAARRLKGWGINLFKFPVLLSSYVKDYHWRTIAVVNHRQHIFPIDKSKSTKCCFILMDSLFDTSSHGKTKRSKFGVVKEHISYLSEILILHAKDVVPEEKEKDLIPFDRFRSEVDQICFKGESILYIKSIISIISCVN